MSDLLLCYCRPRKAGSSNEIVKPSFLLLPIKQSISTLCHEISLEKADVPEKMGNAMTMLNYFKAVAL